jgi:hypothetical protein
MADGVRSNVTAEGGEARGVFTRYVFSCVWTQFLEDPMLLEINQLTVLWLRETEVKPGPQASFNGVMEGTWIN